MAKKLIPGGLFIALEGGEGAGKTSLIQEIGQRLTGRGRDVLITCEPGATNLGRKLRHVWLDSELAGGDIDGIEALFVFAADRHAHVRQVILPALAAGKIVLSDRYVFSAKAYQESEGVDADVVDRVCDIATGGLLPRRTYWLDVSPQIGLARIRRQKRTEAASKYDLAGLAFHDRVRAGFRRQWQEHPDQITRIDADESSEHVANRVYDDLSRLL